MKFPIPPIQNTQLGSLPWLGWFASLTAFMSYQLPSQAALGNYANDTAAAAGGVKLYGYYRNGSVVMQRVV